jgi:hypothetical protein
MYGQGPDVRPYGLRALLGYLTPALAAIAVVTVRRWLGGGGKHRMPPGRLSCRDAVRASVIEPVAHGSVCVVQGALNP